MDTTTQTANQYTDALQVLLAGRMNAGEELAQAAEQMRIAQARLREAESEYTSAFSRALAAGWTEKELRKVFGSVPSATSPRKKRATRQEPSSPAAPAASAASTPAPSGDLSAAPEPDLQDAAASTPSDAA